MNKIKEIRQSFNMTQKQLAEMLKTTQQTIGRWENDVAEPSLDALRDMALIFQCSVDDILGRQVMSRQFASNHLAIAGKDGFWGHFGVKIAGVEHTKWYPITLTEAERLTKVIDRDEGDGPWFVVTTLNNRALAVNTDNVRRIWLLDDACDGPDDWVIDDQEYNGLPLELYHGLERWSDREMGNGWDEEESTTYAEVIKAFVAERALTPEDVYKFLHESEIYYDDGAVERYVIDPEHAYSLFHECDIDVVPKLTYLPCFGGDFESYYPTSRLALVQMPLIDLHEVMKEDDPDYDD